MNKICNILYALDPRMGSVESYANGLFDAMITHMVQETSNQPQNYDEGDDIGGHDLRSWYADTFAALIRELLNPDSLMDDAVREELIKDLDQFLEDRGMDQKDNTEAFVAQTTFESVMMFDEVYGAIKFFIKSFTRYAGWGKASTHIESTKGSKWKGFSRLLPFIGVRCFYPLPLIIPPVILVSILNVDS